MTDPSNTLPPKRLSELLAEGRAVLFDVREADEFARRHIAGSLSRPLSRFREASAEEIAGRAVVFACRSGMRTQANCARLLESVDGEGFILEGGLDAWAAAGLPLETDRKAPLEIMRQVQMAAGALVLAGVGLGLAVHPALFGLAAFVGAGLLFAGATGFCGMARLLALAPWNRPTGA